MSDAMEVVREWLDPHMTGDEADALRRVLAVAEAACAENIHDALLDAMQVANEQRQLDERRGRSTATADDTMAQCAALLAAVAALTTTTEGE